jgi:hypothetical protein
MFKHFHTIVINSLLVILLIGILVMPITTLGLTGFKDPEKDNVLSVQDKQQEETTKTIEIDIEKEQEYYRELMKSIKESTESTTAEVLDSESTEQE